MCNPMPHRLLHSPRVQHETDVVRFAQKVLEAIVQCVIKKDSNEI